MTNLWEGEKPRGSRLWPCSLRSPPFRLPHPLNSNAYLRQLPWHLNKMLAVFNWREDSHCFEEYECVLLNFTKYGHSKHDSYPVPAFAQPSAMAQCLSIVACKYRLMLRTLTTSSTSFLRGHRRVCRTVRVPAKRKQQRAGVLSAEEDRKTCPVKDISSYWPLYPSPTFTLLNKIVGQK